MGGSGKWEGETGGGSSSQSDARAVAAGLRARGTRAGNAAAESAARTEALTPF